LFALALLVTEAALGVAAQRALPGDQFHIELIGVSLFAFVVVVTAILTVAAPGPLMGREWLRAALAESLAEAVVDGLHGTIANLTDVELRVQTWVRLETWIERQQGQEGQAEQEFRKFLVKGIHDRVVQLRMPELKEAIESQLRIVRAS
jgi:hypothetical protein